MADLKQWATGIKSLFKPKGEELLNEFLEEVNIENEENMSNQKEFDVDVECRPTFEQLSAERIADAINKDVLLLKSMETVLQERHQSFTLFIGAISKARPSFDSFQYADGSLRQGLDSLFVYMEQELQQARLQNYLADLRRSISDVKNDALRKLGDYQREISSADKEIASAEKKLAKSKDSLEKAIRNRADLADGRFSFDSNRDRLRDAEDAAVKAEKELRDDVTALLRVLRHKDNVSAATRRAHQRLDRECKNAMSGALQKILQREREACESRIDTLHKLETSICAINTESDSHDFVESHISSEGCLVMASQALSILGDLIVNEDTSSPSSSRSPSPSTIASPRHQLRKGSEISRSMDSSVSSNISATGQSSAGDNGASSTSTAPARGGPNGVRRSIGSDNNPSPAISLLVSKFNSPMTVVQPSLISAEGKARTSRPVGKRLSENVFMQAASSPEEQLQLQQSELSLDITKHLTRMFYAGEEDWKERPESLVMHSGLDIAQSRSNRTTNRPTSTAEPPSSDAIDVKVIIDKEASSEQKAKLITESITWLEDIVKSQPGRYAFITVLNQFRSRKVDIGGGFSALGAVLWHTLDMCMSHNDVHSASVIMMLSQTFYRRFDPTTKRGTGISSASSSERITEGQEADDDSTAIDPAFETIDSELGRAGSREYLKEMLCSHTIWHNGGFWDKALWHCAVDQLKQFPYERPWYDMDREERDRAVRRVHAVIFSQVMAITHSMIELGCSQTQTREFLYRMCTIHQLEESQRQQLLGHLHSTQKHLGPH